MDWFPYQTSLERKKIIYTIKNLQNNLYFWYYLYTYQKLKEELERLENTFCFNNSSIISEVNATDSTELRISRRKSAMVTIIQYRLQTKENGIH